MKNQVENYSWDWLAQRVDAELIPLAKIYVQNPGSGVYWSRTWSGGKETTPEDENLRGLCRHFDAHYIGKEAASNKDDLNFSLICMIVDTLGKAWDTLKALAMVETGTWKKLPDIYNNEKDFEILNKRGLIAKNGEKWEITSKLVQKHAFLRGRFVWGENDYLAKNDSNCSDFYVERDMEIPSYVKDYVKDKRKKKVPK